MKCFHRPFNTNSIGYWFRCLVIKFTYRLVFWVNVKHSFALMLSLLELRLRIIDRVEFNSVCYVFFLWLGVEVKVILRSKENLSRAS